MSAVVMGLSHTIAKERLFEPLRRRLGGKRTWKGYLVSCPYCVSHWVAFLVVPLTGAYYIPVAPDWGPVSDVLRWFFSSILVTVVAAFLRVAFYYVDEAQGLTRRRQVTEQEEAELQRLRLRRAHEEERHPEWGTARSELPEPSGGRRPDA